MEIFNITKMVAVKFGKYQKYTGLLTINGTEIETRKQYILKYFSIATYMLPHTTMKYLKKTQRTRLALFSILKNQTSILVQEQKSTYKNIYQNKNHICWTSMRTSDIKFKFIKN